MIRVVKLRENELKRMIGNYVKRAINENNRRKNSTLNEIVGKVLKNVLFEQGMDDFERASQKHTIQKPDGTIITMSHASYLKWKRNQKKETEGGKNPIIKTGDELAPNQLHEKIRKLIKSAAPLQSLYTFSEHSYRSYGNIAKEMMQPFEKEYGQFWLAYKKINDSLELIKKLGKANEFEAYEEARKLTYNIEDMQMALVNLCDTVRKYKKEIKAKYGNTAAYNGRVDKNNPKAKKELGFADQLFSKSPKAVSQAINNLQQAAQEIVDIANRGRNPLSYEI